VSVKRTYTLLQIVV